MIIKKRVNLNSRVFYHYLILKATAAIQAAVLFC